MARLWIGLGSLSGLIAVGMAALAVHGVASIGPARLEVLRNGIQMQGWHALALVGCGLWALRSDSTLAHLAGRSSWSERYCSAGQFTR
jgi:uncharacterized membrane protein YgdD (TMEM256/DUF423 family)